MTRALAVVAALALVSLGWQSWRRQPHHRNAARGAEK